MTTAQPPSPDRDRPTPADDPVAAAVDRLYEAFARTPRPTAIDACPHCCSEQDTAPLLAPTPLRELTAAALSPYASKAVSTVGSAADFRYFLPRLLELTAADAFGGWPDLAVVARKLPLAAWRDWDPQQQDAIRVLLHALWHRILTGHPTADPDRFLDALNAAHLDSTPYLDAWTAAIGRPTAAEGLLTVLRYNTRATRRRSGPDQFTQWITSPRLRSAVAAAFETAETEAAMQTLADLHEHLGWR